MVQDTAPSAVRIADPIDTMICTTNLIPSFFVIISHFLNLSLLTLIQIIAAIAAAIIVAAVGITAS